jgi:glutathione S-transferase
MSVILHHYEYSPFSEKVRAMFGYTGLEWQSVIVREFPPRPGLDELTGGYRKIPVGQIGADLFCDTRTISAEIAQLAGKPELDLNNCSDDVKQFVRSTDLQVFLACVLSANGKNLAKKIRRERSLLHLARFLFDRINMGRKATVNAPRGPKQAKAMVRDHLDRLENMLQHDFLFGDQPNIADFSAYHGLWFIRDASESGMLASWPGVNEWMDRIRAFGHGFRTDIDMADALKQARDAEPRKISSGAAQQDGREVSIAPSDYGQKAVTGVLVAESEHEWVLEREHKRCGTVHVHFPTQGFSLT